MARHVDAIIIGSGLGGLIAAGLYARTGQRALVLERNDEVGGAATVCHHGGLAIEASLLDRRRCDDYGRCCARVDNAALPQHGRRRGLRLRPRGSGN